MCIYCVYMDGIAENINILCYTMRLIYNIHVYLLYVTCTWPYTSVPTSIGCIYVCVRRESIGIYQVPMSGTW